MAPTTYKIRVDTEQVEAWKKSAGSLGLKLAEWIRKNCDEVAGGVGGHEDGSGKNVQRPGDVVVDRRRVGASRGLRVRGGAEAARLAHNQEVAGSSPAPATKVSLEDVVQETRARRASDDPIETAVAQKTGHEVGHQCLECVGVYRFILGQRQAEKKAKSKAS